MNYNNGERTDNFRPLDNSVRTSLRYQIEAEKQLEAYSNAFNRSYRSNEGDSVISLLSSIIKGVFYLVSGIIHLLFKK
jgi:hypothetical protein